MAEINLVKRYDLSKVPMAVLKNLTTLVKDEKERKVIRGAIGQKHQAHASRMVAAKKKRSNRNHKKQGVLSCHT